MTTPLSLQEALKLAIRALNEIPNRPNSEYGNTYKLIPVLEKALNEAEPTPRAKETLSLAAEHLRILIATAQTMQDVINLALGQPAKINKG